jgi:hypothetical protein
MFYGKLSGTSYNRLVERYPLDERSRANLAARRRNGRAAGMERIITLSNQQLFISVIGVAERSQLAPQDFFWNGEMIWTQHISLLVTEG